MNKYPRSCEEVLKDLEERKQRYAEDGCLPARISEKAILHRLIRSDDIDLDTQKPSKSTFTSHGLSVLVESEDCPLDIREEVENSSIFVGAVFLSVEDLLAMGYEIHPDPHPDPCGKPQHPNHAQVVCKKTQGNAKKMRDGCAWSVRPDSLRIVGSS